MLKSDFLERFGLFFEHGFLDPELCARLRSETRAVPSNKGKVFLTDGGPVVDETSRKVHVAIMAPETIDGITARFMSLVPRLNAHFGLTLGQCEKPSFLKYDKGAYYRAHEDSSDDPASHLSRRKVSVVVFLNGPADEPSAEHYGGGALAFYGLMEGPEFKSVGFPLQAEPGLLVAFRSETTHEVQPVLHGERFTIVTWFAPLDGPETVR